MTSATFYGSALDASAGENTVFRFSKQFRRSNGQWKLTYTVPDNLATGNWLYQVWTNQGRRKYCPFNGEFKVAPSLVSRVADTGMPDAGLSTDLERQLATVKEAIKNYIQTGAASWSIAGNSTTKITLMQLYKEHDRLCALVNAERDEKGLPQLLGTPADEINFYPT